MMYRATHDETGEVIEGSAKELASVLKVVPTSINKTALKHGIIKKHWVLQSIGQMRKESVKRENPVVCVEKSHLLPATLCDEWDAVTKPFKERSKERRREQHE